MQGAQEQEAHESWRRITLAHELGAGVSSLPDTLPVAPWRPEVPLTSVVAVMVVVPLTARMSARQLSIGSASAIHAGEDTKLLVMSESA